MKIDKLRWEVPLTETTTATITIDKKTFALNLSITGVSDIVTHQAAQLGLAILEASALAGQARADRGLPAPPRVVIRHAGGYDPRLGRDHPNNFDPTLEQGPVRERIDDRDMPADEPSPNYTDEKNGAVIVQAATVAVGDEIEVKVGTRDWSRARIEYMKGAAMRYVLLDAEDGFFDFVSLSDEGKTWRRKAAEE